MGARQQTVRISIFFFLLFTPFSSYMTILTHIYEQDNLPGIGPATLAVNYVAFMLSIIAAPALRKTLKVQLLLGGIFYTLNYSSGFFAAMTDQPQIKFLISCTGSAISGLSSGFMWVSQGRYIHLACQKYGDLSRKGQMYGIFSSIYCFANVSAGLITTFGLGFFDAQKYFLIITALGIIAILFCFFFVRNIQEIKGLQQKTEIQGNSSEVKQSLLDEQGQSFAQNTLPESKQQKSQKKYSALKTIKGTMAFIPTMYPIILILVIDGLSLAVYSSQIPHLIPSDTSSDILNIMTGVAIICMGVGATIGGFLSGLISDKAGQLTSGRTGLITWVISCGIVIADLFWPSLWLTFIAAFCWGFSLFFLEGWMYIICSRCYKGKSEAFSVNKLLHCFLYLLSQIVILATSNNLPLKYIFPSMALLSIPAILLIPKVPGITKKQ